jgi:site-specific DNA-methyltransferase (adenine-specific)
MDYMKTMPDKFFDLCICDPPYGIDINKSGRLVGEKGWKYKDWDKYVPDKNYFDELFRVSKNQIVWGGNYYEMPATRCYIIWDKKQPEGVSFASAELAWTSFDRSTKTFYWHPQASNENRIHPTQKPIALYKWILGMFAKQSDKILDTHVGSGSSLIACIEGGFNYWGTEIDKDYYEAAQKRIARAFRQYDLNLE